MAMAGRGISPTVEETEKFIEIVKEFRANNPDQVVGIHCTHGFNRTGFLITAYLYQVEVRKLHYSKKIMRNLRNGV